MLPTQPDCLMPLEVTGLRPGRVLNKKFFMLIVEDRSISNRNIVIGEGGLGTGQDTAASSHKDDISVRKSITEAGLNQTYL